MRFIGRAVSLFVLTQDFLAKSSSRTNDWELVGTSTLHTGGDILSDFGDRERCMRGGIIPTDDALGGIIGSLR